MKKQLFLVPIVIISILLMAGCSNYGEQMLEEGTSLNESNEAKAGQTEREAGQELPEPPGLKIRAGDNTIEALLGTYSWSVDNEDGTVTSIEADTAPPPDLIQEMTPIVVASDTIVELDFEVEPSRYTVRTWEEDYTVSSSRDEVLLTRSGLVIFEVRSSWSQGTANYVFILDID